MRILIIVLIGLSLFSCGSEMEDTRVVENINLFQPKPGQLNKYVHYFTDDGSDPTTIQYVADTMLVEIISVNGNKITISEKLTPNSIEYEFYEERITTLTLEEDQLVQDSCSSHESSYLMAYFKFLPFEGQDTLVTTYENYLPDSRKADHVTNIEINTSNYDYLLMKYENRQICDDGLVFDFPTRTVLYSKEHFIVRRFIVSKAWSDIVSGWDLLL